MKKIQKPQLTPVVKERLNLLYNYLKAHGYCTRETLCKALGWPYNSANDRRTRELVSIIASRFPVISSSDKNIGYKLAVTAFDAKEVQHTWKELDSRIAELEKRKAPLIEFLTKMGVNQSPLNAK